MRTINLPSAIVCSACRKIFREQRYLKHHKKKFHPELATHTVGQDDNKLGRVLCQEEGCSSSFQTIVLLRNHLRSSHGLKMELELNSFKNNQEFQVWIRTIERENSCTFVNSTGNKRDQNGVIRKYFYCYRSGQRATSTSKDPRKITLRTRAARASSKIGHHCTASIVVRIDVAGQVHVEYHKTHYNHAADLAHLRRSACGKRSRRSRKGPLDIKTEAVACTENDINTPETEISECDAPCFVQASSVTEVAMHVQSLPSPDKRTDTTTEKTVLMMTSCLEAMTAGKVSTEAYDAIYPHIMYIKAVVDNCSVPMPTLVPLGSRSVEPSAMNIPGLQFFSTKDKMCFTNVMPTLIPLSSKTVRSTTN